MKRYVSPGNHTILIDFNYEGGGVGKAGTATLLDPMIAGPEGGPSSDMQRFED
jgi:hypothetical protein